MLKDVNNTLKLFIVISSYWIISIVLIFVNKRLLSGHDDVTLYVTWVQSLITVTFLVGSNYFRRTVLKQNVYFPQMSLTILLQPDFLILSVSFTLMLVFNGLCLRNVGVAFFQVARSLSLIFTVAITWVVLLDKATINQILCCFVVIFGFSLGVLLEHSNGSVTLIGIVYGILSSFFIALYSVYTKRIIQLFNGDVITMVYHLNILTVLILLPIIIMTDQLKTAFLIQKSDFVFTLYLVISGLLSYLISIVATLQISFTSPLTHHLSNFSRSACTTMLAVSISNETKEPIWWLSHILVLSGGFGNAIAKLWEKPASTCIIMDNNICEDDI